MVMIDLPYSEVAQLCAAQTERSSEADLSGPVRWLEVAISGGGASGSRDTLPGSPGQLHIGGKIALTEEQPKRSAFSLHCVGAALCGEAFAEILRGEIGGALVQLLQLLRAVMFPGPLRESNHMALVVVSGAVAVDLAGGDRPGGTVALPDFDLGGAAALPYRHEAIESLNNGIHDALSAAH